MIVAASQVFGFLEQRPTCSIEKHEIHLGAFSVLRRSICLIVVRLNEDGDDESQEIADRCRTLLSEWLTVPVPFDDSFLESTSALGDADAIDRRWGHEVRTAYDHACGAARLLQRAENPARGEVRNAVRQLGSLGPPGRFTATGERALTLNRSLRTTRSRRMSSCTQSRTTVRPNLLTA